MARRGRDGGCRAIRVEGTNDTESRGTMTIKISTLGHVVLRTPDLPTSLRFYRTLGLHDVATEEFDGERWVFLSSGNSHHELALVEDPTTAGETGPLHHVGFKVGDSVDELVAVKADLEESGSPPLATLDFRVSQALFVRDPDGNMIELYVDTPGEPWRLDPTLVASATPIEI